jgi:iron complex outermembrane receptor protein
MKASTISYAAATPAEYTFDCAVTCSFNFGGPAVSGQKAWNNVGWKLGVDWKVTPETLLYASWARGFKSGGFAGRLGIASDLGPYNPEKVDTFEGGVKADLLDRHLRVNLTGFYTNYRDIQLAQIYFIIDQATNTFIQGNTILNAASAHIKGFELETTAIPFDGLTLTGSVGYLDAKYKDFPFIDPFSLSPANPTGIQYNFKGNRLQNAPKWTAVAGVSYEFSAGGDDKVQINGTYKYTSSKILTAIDNANRSFVQPTGLFDANIEYFIGDRMSVSFWGRNIFDKRYIQSVYDNFGYGALVSYQNPRELGVTGKFNF